MALTSLTDATMAGILATRSSPSLPSTKTLPPPPVARKKGPVLRQTMRRTPEKEEDAKPKQHKHLRRKKHTHHEGSRRRWREVITERERKRYEAVWASNRGLLLGSPGTTPVSGYGSDTSGSGGDARRATGDAHPSQLVCNVVVRDVWSRSRLPADELAEVWDLVNTDGRSALDRTSFVVGMWLIDQRLRGRKIPPKVSDSVWSSAKGLNVLNPKKR